MTSFVPKLAMYDIRRTIYAGAFHQFDTMPERTKFLSWVVNEVSNGLEQLHVDMDIPETDELEDVYKKLNSWISAPTTPLDMKGL